MELDSPIWHIQFLVFRKKIPQEQSRTSPVVKTPLSPRVARIRVISDYTHPSLRLYIRFHSAKNDSTLGDNNFLTFLHRNSESCPQSITCSERTISVLKQAWAKDQTITSRDSVTRIVLPVRPTNKKKCLNEIDA
jgi:hypothetical protein